MGMSDLQQRLTRLEAQVSSLERLVQFLSQVSGLDLSALRRAETADLLALYQDAVMLLAIPGNQFDEEIFHRWSEVFLQISEFELTKLKEVVKYDHTWQPFYQLCSRMMTTIRQKKDFLTTLTLQHLYAVLDKGRKNMRDAALIMIQNASSEPPPMAKTLLQEGSKHPPVKAPK